MNITVIGTGYVGLVTGTCLASQGFNVLCCDLDGAKIEKLKKNELSIYEPGLSALVGDCLKAPPALAFTTNMIEAVSYSNVLFVTVNTPTLEDNSCYLENVFNVAKDIARWMNCYKVIVHKSTVPVGTGRRVKALISSVLKESGKDVPFDIVSNPEFLREGAAVSDFMNPDRVVIGSDSATASKIMKEIYSFQISKGTPLLETGIETAEMIKYASNSFLAAKISFINEIANICELCGADALTAAKGIGLDNRIGAQFLEPGPGFGGSCFPKDIKALSGIAASLGYDAGLINSIFETNTRQKARMSEKIKAVVKPLENKVISILGLSFKVETDDIREAPAISIIEELLSANAQIRAYDPKAMDNMKKQYPRLDIIYCENPYDACEGSDCIVILTGWKEFCCLDLKKLLSIVRTPVFMDFRNLYDPMLVKNNGFYYEGVGRKI